MKQHKDFAKRLATAMEYSGISGTLTEKGAKLKVSKPYMSELLRGDRRPSGEKLSEIAIILGVNADWLHTGRGEMVPTIAEGIIDVSILPEDIKEIILDIYEKHHPSN